MFLKNNQILIKWLSILKKEKSGDKFHLKIELSAEEFLKLKNQLDQDGKINLSP